MSTPKLFQPLRVGDVELGHRVVFAPVTRYRVDDTHTPLPHVAEYYEQRASTAGSLLISEATLIAQQAGGARNTPGIWSDDQITAWKAVRGPSTVLISLLTFILGHGPRPCKGIFYVPPNMGPGSRRSSGDS
jgi:hypothetical protein